MFKDKTVQNNHTTVESFFIKKLIVIHQITDYEQFQNQVKKTNFSILFILFNIVVSTSLNYVYLSSIGLVG